MKLYCQWGEELNMYVTRYRVCSLCNVYRLVGCWVSKNKFEILSIKRRL